MLTEKYNTLYYQAFLQNKKSLSQRYFFLDLKVSDDIRPSDKVFFYLIYLKKLKVILRLK